MATPSKEPHLREASRKVVLLFGLTYVGYALLYFVRKPFGVVKADLQARHGLSTGTLAGVDMAFLLAYTVSNLLVGRAEALLGTHRTLVLAFAGSAAATAAFPCSDWPGAWMLCWVAQGTFQAWVYPLCAKLLTQELAEHVRNSLWGVWVTCQHLGGMLGTLAAAELHKAFGWRAAFFAPSLGVALAGAGIQLFLPGGGRRNAKKDPDVDAPHGSAAEHKQGPSLSAAIQLPSIKELGASYCCIKLVRYVGVLWVPFFLGDLGFDAETAALLSVAFDVGGVLGGTLCGVAADALLGGRLLAVILGMCASSALLSLVYAVWHPVLGRIGHAGILFWLGVMVAGPDANFGGAACMNAVDRAGGGSREAASAASGFVNSMGALGTVFTGVLVTLARGGGGGGWVRVWHILAGLCALPCAVLAPSALAEHRHMVLREKGAAARGGTRGKGRGGDDGALPPQRLGMPADAEEDADEDLPMLRQAEGSPGFDEAQALQELRVEDDADARLVRT